MVRTTHTLSIVVPIPPSVGPSILLDHLHSHIPVFQAQAYVRDVKHVPLMGIPNSSSLSPSAWPSPSSSLASIVTDPFFLADGLKIRSFLVQEAVPLIPGYWEKNIYFSAMCQNLRSGLRVRANAPAGVRVWSEYLVMPRRLARSGVIEKTYELSAEEATVSVKRPHWMDDVERKLQSSSSSLPSSDSSGPDEHLNVIQHDQFGGNGEDRSLDLKEFPNLHTAVSGLGILGGRNDTFIGGAKSAASSIHSDDNEPYDLIEHVLVECNSILMPFVARSMEGAHRELCQKIIDGIEGHR